MDRRMLIGLAVLAVVIVAFYFLVMAPSQAYTFEDGFFELNALAENRGVSVITFTEFEGSNIDGFKNDLAAFKSQLNTQTDSMDSLALQRFVGVLEDFAEYRLTVAEFNELNDEIYQVPFDQLCGAVALMDERDQAASQAINDTQEFGTSLTAFVTAFPSQAATVQMSTVEFDTQGLQNAKTTLEANTSSIKDICENEGFAAEEVFESTEEGNK